jgi:hypothetical protein
MIIELRSRARGALLLSLLALGLLPATALAHAVVFPKRAEPGAYERYLLRVPNERGVPTERVEITFPAGVKVVSFGEVMGWTLEVRRNAAGAITGAVWTGTLPVERFVEFPFVAVNPKQDATVSWVVAQTYAGGEKVDWSGPEGSRTPASTTHIAAPEGPDRTGLWLGGAGLVVGLLALGLVLRRPLGA